MIHPVDDLVRELRPVDRGDVESLFSQDERDELYKAIVNQPRPSEPAGVAPRAALRPGWLPSLNGVRQTAVLCALAAAGATTLIAAVLLFTGSAIRPQPATAAIAFHSSADGDIVATITNPFVSERGLRAAFERHGLDITVTLVPVSPSLIGTVIYISDDGGRDAIQSLQGGHCVTGGGGCAIGLKIPRAFTGRGFITLGRPAKAGESYESQASAFAPGEALHCSGLVGAQVSSALPALRRRGLVVQWRADPAMESGARASTTVSRGSAVPSPTSYIWEALMTAPGRVIVWTHARPLPSGLAASARRYDKGC